MDRVDELVQEHLEPEVLQRLAGAIRQAKTRSVLLLSDADHDGTFGLLLLREDGLEFLGADGRVVVGVRDDVVLADPRSRGTMAVTFADGEELTFTDVGDSTWTRQLAQAINRFASDGPTAVLAPSEEGAEPTDDAEPFPHAVVSIIDGAAAVGLVLGLLVGVGAVVVSFGTGDSEESDPAGIVAGVAIIVVSALQWAFFKAVTLGLTYLWRIQFELAHNADVG